MNPFLAMRILITLLALLFLAKGSDEKENLKGKEVQLSPTTIQNLLGPNLIHLPGKVLSFLNMKDFLKFTRLNNLCFASRQKLLGFYIGQNITITREILGKDERLYEFFDLFGWFFRKFSLLLAEVNLMKYRYDCSSSKSQVCVKMKSFTGRSLISYRLSGAIPFLIVVGPDYPFTFDDIFYDATSGIAKIFYRNRDNVRVSCAYRTLVLKNKGRVEIYLREKYMNSIKNNPYMSEDSNTKYFEALEEIYFETYLFILSKLEKQHRFEYVKL